jgi:hypothetical protein
MKTGGASVLNVKLKTPSSRANLPKEEKRSESGNAAEMDTRIYSKSGIQQ